MMRAATTFLTLGLLARAASSAALPQAAAVAETRAPAAETGDERGVVLRTPEACPGYTLVSPFSNTTTYLLDLDGRVVHQWESAYHPGLSPYLLDDGRLLRGIAVETPLPIKAGGRAGGLQMFSWDGELLWQYHLASTLAFHHHDIEPLPNGNVLVIGWEARTRLQARDVGRLPSCIGDNGLWPCAVFEIEPLPPIGARVVWEWHVWDHLIQDLDPDLPNYGNVADHPERVNINADIPKAGAPDGEVTDAERAQLKKLGYIGADDDLDDKEKNWRKRADWLHLNAVDYNSQLDQIALSSAQLSEVWIIDHGTTRDEARGSSGGRQGKGGDLLWRWGNPQNWQQGGRKDRQLFHQHDVSWVRPGQPGAGHLTIFNNGRERPEGEWSRVFEIAPPLQKDGSYAREEGTPYGPAAPCWVYDPPAPDRFYASFISGAHRLGNGNTLVCSGPEGRAFEVTSAGKIVWDWKNPFGDPGEGGDPELLYGLFRATRIGPDHPALKGRTLVPLEPQPKTVLEIVAERKSHEPPREPGWQPLVDAKLGLDRWVPVNVAGGQTFTVVPDPDDAKEVMIHSTGKPTGILRSDRMYENFLCEFEWRHLAEPGNAGFFVWADPLPALGGPFTRGIEVQVCNLGNGDGFTSHGDLFPIWGATMTPDPRFRISGARSMPRTDAFHALPTGQWNHYRISCIDGAITLEVNGHLVTAGAACSPSKGYLCLESEGTAVDFRKIQIWELPSGTHAADAARTATAAGADESLFDGLGLDGFTVRTGTWSAQDWRITCKAGDPAELERALPDGTVELRLDFKRDAAVAPDSLPFRLGDTRFESRGEKRGEWNRVRVRLLVDRFELDLNGERRDVARTAGTALPALVLCGDGTATEYCSLFAAAE